MDLNGVEGSRWGLLVYLVFWRVLEAWPHFNDNVMPKGL